MATATATSLCARWLTRRDLTAVVRLDEQHYPADHPAGWSECDYLEHLKDRTTIGMVADDGDAAITGAAIYRLERDRLNVLKLFGSQDARRVLIGRLLGKLSCNRPSIVVRETDGDVITQCRARRLTGRLLPGHFPDCDGVKFSARLPADC